MIDIFSPIKLGKLQLENRIFMAPMTRSRAAKGHIPTDVMATYYSQRATAGLIISEATMITPGNSSFGSEPGIYNSSQVSGWRLVTEAVHAKGGKIFVQLWHGGRACHSALNQGQRPVGPSPIAIEDVIHTPEGKLPYEVPRELEVAEILQIISNFKSAARNAIEAGFDGVEVHGANGYLIDQFLRSNSNERSDLYGGSIENRSRFLLQVIDAVISEVGADKVGLRLSPINSFNSMYDSDPMNLLAFLCKSLNKRKLAYLHIMRADFHNQQHGEPLSVARQHFSGNLIANMNYSSDEGTVEIQNNNVDCIAFGSSFISNPDLPYRLANKIKLSEPDQTTFYSGGPLGYIDYPTFENI